MKTNFLKALCLSIFSFFLFACGEDCEKCEDCEKLSKDEQIQITKKIEKGLDEYLKPFSEIKLPVFLGKKTNNIPQHLHIEGSIRNPFLITGTFTSEVVDKDNCKVTALKLEVIPTGASGAIIKNYKFDGTPTISSDGKDGLKISAKIIKDSSAPGATPNNANVTLPNPIIVKRQKIIDMTISYSGTKNKFTIDEVSIDYCCHPVICKSIIYF
ncbi:hypothetical protein [uncultured Psychroserpens sp.]|uniref:hypothetical protein n=1 Tax=uncultured Psychroserpens sp. TaxID=255436 RepID=UPI002638BAC0|nr:hypothetical protein [uncultured Psychroserpens sp.]